MEEDSGLGGGSRAGANDDAASGGIALDAGFADSFVVEADTESTVNQLINWRFCKEQQMTWTRTGEQGLLHVKTALLNGRLNSYTGMSHSVATAA
jgi:hypothetical protein